MDRTLELLSTYACELTYRGFTCCGGASGQAHPDRYVGLCHGGVLC